MSKSPAYIRDNYDEVVPNFFAGVENEVYHKDLALGRSGLCDIVDYSVSTYLMRQESNTKPSDPMIKGSALHDRCLLPSVFDANYSIGPTVGRNTIKWKAFAKENPNKVILTPGMACDVEEMRDALYSNSSIKDILDSDTILREVSSWVVCPNTKLNLKIRPDIIVDGVIYDLKSTIAPHEKAFSYSIDKYNYHVQAAYYMDCAQLAGMQITDFVFLVVGSKPPYLTAIYNLDDERVLWGREKYQEALNIYSKYLLSDDQWDGLSYGRELVTL